MSITLSEPEEQLLIGLIGLSLRRNRFRCMKYKDPDSCKRAADIESLLLKIREQTVNTPDERK